MHKALSCTCPLKFPPLLFFHPSYQFCNETWPLLPSSSISFSLLIVVIFLFFCVCKVLLIMPPHFHFFCPYSFCLFLICDPLLFVLSHCLRNSVCWIRCCLVLPHLSSYLVLVADCCIFFHFLLPLFFLLVYWHVVCFQQPKTYSPPPLYVQLSLGSMELDPWLSGQVGGLAIQSFHIQSIFSARPGAALKIRCQSSVKESASKKLLQRVGVLLWWIV